MGGIGQTKDRLKKWWWLDSWFDHYYGGEKGRWEEKKVKHSGKLRGPSFQPGRGPFDPLLMSISSPSCYRPITFYSLCFNKSRITNSPLPSALPLGDVLWNVCCCVLLSAVVFSLYHNRAIPKRASSCQTCAILYRKSTIITDWD